MLVIFLGDMSFTDHVLVDVNVVGEWFGEEK
jgi:hypothetical protein